MPYKFETEKKKLPKNLDRRVKLSDDDKLAIKKLIDSTSLSNAEIWEKFWVHRKTIYLIRNPRQAKKEKEEFKIRRLDWRYYNKDIQNQAIKETRKYKKSLKDKLI